MSGLYYSMLYVCYAMAGLRAPARAMMHSRST